jgi:hypothetical protein
MPIQQIDTKVSQAAALLIERLKSANSKVLNARASEQFIDGLLKMGLAFAVFLVDVADGTSQLSAEQIRGGLASIERHCNQIESDLPIAA